MEHAANAEKAFEQRRKKLLAWKEELPADALEVEVVRDFIGGIRVDATALYEALLEAGKPELMLEIQRDDDYREYVPWIEMSAKLPPAGLSIKLVFVGNGAGFKQALDRGNDSHLKVLGFDIDARCVDAKDVKLLFDCLDKTTGRIELTVVGSNAKGSRAVCLALLAAAAKNQRVESFNLKMTSALLLDEAPAQEAFVELLGHTLQLWLTLEVPDLNKAVLLICNGMGEKQQPPWLLQLLSLRTIERNWLDPNLRLPGGDATTHAEAWNSNWKARLKSLLDAAPKLATLKISPPIRRELYLSLDEALFVLLEHRALTRLGFQVAELPPSLAKFFMTACFARNRDRRRQQLQKGSTALATAVLTSYSATLSSIAERLGHHIAHLAEIDAPAARAALGTTKAASLTSNEHWNKLVLDNQLSDVLVDMLRDYLAYDYERYFAQLHNVDEEEDEQADDFNVCAATLLGLDQLQRSLEKALGRHATIEHQQVLETIGAAMWRYLQGQIGPQPTTLDPRASESVRITIRWLGADFAQLQPPGIRFDPPVSDGAELLFQQVQTILDWVIDDVHSYLCRADPKADPTAAVPLLASLRDALIAQAVQPLIEQLYCGVMRIDAPGATSTGKPK